MSAAVAPAPRRASKPAAPPALISVTEIAHDLRCTRGHIYHLLDDGTLPCVRLGKLRRVPRVQYEAWRDAQIADAEAAQTQRRRAAWQALSSSERASAE